jgi:hypothetical protein
MGSLLGHSVSNYLYAVLLVIVSLALNCFQPQPTPPGRFTTFSPQAIIGPAFMPGRAC